MRILDVGCGVNKLAGAIGLDRNPASRADVLADLDHFPYPFRDSSFDKLQAVPVDIEPHFTTAEQLLAAAR